MKHEPLPSLLDRQIRSKHEDAFGHWDFAEALKSLVESPSNEPPFSIGLLGGWGTGKSTIKQLYVDDVAADREQDANGFIRSKKIKIVTFNAWRFGGEGNLKRPLLKTVFLGLGGNQGELTDILFRHRTSQENVRKSFWEIVDEVFEKYLWNFCPLLFCALFWFAIMALALYLGVTGSYTNTIVAVCALALSGILTFAAKDPSRFMIARTRTITKLESPQASAEEFEELLHSQIRKFAQTKEGKHCERLVIFVDDLDRLSAEELVAGLDAIRSFMEMPLDSDSLKIGVVFVISCDEARVAEALAKRRRSPDNTPGAVQTEPDARRYLDRIFQFRLEIPPPPKQDLRLFAEERLKTALAPLAKDMTDAGVSIGMLTSRMIHSGVQTPRNVIQILNAFSQSWWIAKKRERECSGTEKTGGLASARVIRWLEAPQNAIDGKSIVFPSEAIENWIGTDEKGLLPVMRLFYGGKTIPIIDALEERYRQAALRRIEQVQRLLIDGSSEERGIFWNSVSTSMGHQNPEVVRMGWSLAAEYSARASGNQLAVATSALASRTSRALTTPNDPLDWKGPTQALVNLLPRVSGYVPADSTAFTALLQSLNGAGEEGERFALATVDNLLKVSPEMTDKTLDAWCQNCLTDIPRQTVVWLGRNIGALNDSRQKVLIASIQGCVANPVGAAEVKRERAKWLIDAILEEFLKARQAETIRPWLSAIRDSRHPTHPQHPQFQQQHQQQVIPLALPIVARLIRIAEIGDAVPFLDNVFNNGTNSLLSTLGTLKDNWPLHQADANYPAGTYFDKGMQAVQNNVADALSGEAVASLADLYNAGQLGDDYAAKLCSLACAVWQRGSNQASKVLQCVNGKPQVQETVSLGEKTNFNSSEEAQVLKDAWTAIANRYTDAELVQGILQVASKSAVRNEGSADCALDVWTDCLGQRRFDVLASAFDEANTTDGQRKRLWCQVERHLKETPGGLLSRIAISVLKRGDNKDTAYTVKVAAPEIGRMIKSGDESYQFSKNILASFRQFPDLDLKRQASDLLRQLDSKGAIADCKWGNDFTPEDLEILSESFPDDRGLKKARRQAE